MLQIYNTLTRRKETFVPIKPGTARLYVCGMTVYDYCHLGHARVMVVFDVVARYLRQYDHVVEVANEQVARQLERQIKGRGIKRYLMDNGFTY